MYFITFHHSFKSPSVPAADNNSIILLLLLTGVDDVILQKAG